MTAPRHFLDLDAFTTATLRSILRRAAAFKSERRRDHRVERPLIGRSLALIFEQPSTRTRISFECAMRELGGEVIAFNAKEMQLGRGEAIADTARVLSRHVDAIMLRTDRHAKLRELAENSSVPVINGLTDLSHPTQVLGDVMTFEEHLGDIAGARVAWVGDANNVATSWIHAAGRFGFELRMACPDGYGPHLGLLRWAEENGARLSVTTDPEAAVAGADCVVTDTWVSMNQDGTPERRAAFEPYRVDGRLMALARPDAIFMHCLPAHRGEEVTAEVIDGPRSVVWDEAENRLHVVKGILTWCLG